MYHCGIHDSLDTKNKQESSKIDNPSSYLDFGGHSMGLKGESKSTQVKTFVCKK